MSWQAHTNPEGAEAGEEETSRVWTVFHTHIRLAFPQQDPKPGHPAVWTPESSILSVTGEPAPLSQMRQSAVTVKEEVTKAKDHYGGHHSRTLAVLPQREQTRTRRGRHMRTQAKVQVLGMPDARVSGSRTVTADFQASPGVPSYGHLN